MRKLAVFLALWCASWAHAQSNAYQPQEGDFVFQSLPRGDLVDAIEGASHSPYSHVGLVVRKSGEWYVREAIGSVMDTPLNAWIQRGRHQHAFDAFRLKGALRESVPALVKASGEFLGRPYDFRYAMDDEAIYCSELLYKAMFKASGVRLGRLNKLGALDWKPYRSTIERYEGGAAPLDREMITPRALSEAGELEKVFDGYHR